MKADPKLKEAVDFLRFFDHKIRKKLKERGGTSKNETSKTSSASTPQVLPEGSAFQDLE